MLGKLIAPNEENSDGCLPFSQEHFDRDDMLLASSGGHSQPLFILVDSGGCSMTHKVRNIQNYGAALAIIAQVSDVDDQDLEKKDLLFGYSSGQSLVIPGILIDE